MKTYDYSAVSAPLGLAEVYQEVKKSPTISWVSAGAGLMSGFLMLGLNLPGYAFYIVAALVGLVTGYCLAMNALKSRRLQQFATDNDLDYMGGAPPSRQRGVIFGPGHSKTIERGFALRGSWLIGNYQYTTGSGKSSRLHEYSFIEIKLPRTLPNVVLDSKKNNWIGLSNLPGSFAGGQKLELEGDFNEYFTVYVPKGYARDALYFLTPELMAMLVDYGSDCDFEVVVDKLYVYHKKIDLEPSNLPTTMEYWGKFIDFFAYQFSDNVERYADTRVLDAKVTNIVAAEGQRLRKRGISLGNWESVLSVGAGVAIFVAVYLLI